MKAKKATPIEACTASTRALSAGGRLPPQVATIAPKSVRIRIQSSIEPSWFPQTPVTL
jgi:hypothetical protein